MYCRLLIALSLFIYAALGNADSVWNCAKSGQEWSCSVAEGEAEPEPAAAPLASAPTATTPAKLSTLPAATSINAEPQPSQTEQQTSEKCAPTANNKTWGCTLSTAQFKGKTRSFEDSATGGIFGSAFNAKQQQIFSTLSARLQYNPWQSCASPAIKPKRALAKKHLRRTTPIDITADYSEVFNKEITQFSGNVEFIRADQNMLSDLASYDTVAKTMDAQGNVYYSEDALYLHSDTALLNLATDQARLRKVLFISPSAPMRGSAAVVYQDSKSLSRYRQVAVTSCRPGNQDWMIRAQRLKINKATGKVSAKQAWLAFKGVPVLYTPYISFPIDERRISGFLTPSFSDNKDNGFDLTIPYYWNIAPNYDLTVWPRYMSKRGGMLSSKLRYLSKTNQGALGLEYLPYDSVLDRARYAGSFKDNSQWTQRLSSTADLNYISDSDYLRDLNNALGLSRNSFLNNEASFSYQMPGLSLHTAVQAYQTIDTNRAASNSPYHTLPKVNLNLTHSFTQWPLDLALSSEYVHFQRRQRVVGQRFDIKPAVALPITTAGAFIKPKLALQHTEYFLQKQDQNTSNHIARTLPILSVDSGLNFEREFTIAQSTFLHSIEPRLFYLYIPTSKQQDIPLFDTALNDFNFHSLFRENRFSGTDRVQDANQLTLAFTSKLFAADSGQERLTLSVGEIFYFSQRRVTLNNTGVRGNDFSNLVAEIGGSINHNLSFSSAMQWNHYADDVTRGRLNLRYRDGREHIINAGYRYRRDDPSQPSSIIQTDISARWPIYDNWFGVGRWVYSLQHNLSPESFLGLEKESCCWRLRMVWRRFSEQPTVQGASNATDQGVFVQLELKGLASFGDKIDDFLAKNLAGYQR